MVQFIETLRYKTKCRGYITNGITGIFLLTYSFLPHYGTGIELPLTEMNIFGSGGVKAAGV